MWTALFLASLLIVAHALKEERQIGICVEDCSTGLIARALRIAGCPEGYECRSNGCGHTCQPVAARSLRQLIGICVEACDGGCPEGQLCLFNGCGHTCQTVE